MCLFPNAADFPNTKVIVDGLPGREVFFRQHTPLTAGSDDIEYGVDDLPTVGRRTTSVLELRKIF